MAELRLEKRGKGWRYVFEAAKVGGKRTRISKGGFATKTEASKAGTKALSEYNRTGLRFQPSEMSYSDLLDKWMKDYCKLELKLVTYRNYAKRIEFHIKPALVKYKIAALDAQILQDFINNLALNNYSRNTLSVVKGILSSSLGFAEKRRYIMYNPIHSVKLPSPRSEKIKSRTAPHCYLPKDIMDKILARFPKGTTPFLPLMIGYRCGLRIGEVYALTWDNIDLEKKTLKVEKQVQWDSTSQKWYFSKPKYDSFRIIEVDDNLCNLLREEKLSQERAVDFYGELYTKYFSNKERQINSDGDGTPIHLVMVRADGSYIQPRTMTHAARIIHYELNIPQFTFHSLRHTHATMLAESNAPPKYVQKRLGHKNISITLQVYQHLSEIISSQGEAVLNEVFSDD